MSARDRRGLGEALTLTVLGVLAILASGLWAQRWYGPQAPARRPHSSALYAGQHPGKDLHA